MSLSVNQIRIDINNFPGGECHLQIAAIEITEKTYIYACLNNSNAIMALLLTVDAIRRVNPGTAIYLTIPYFPYARQDRVCNPGEALGVKVIADMINHLKCEAVTIYDPHSDVTPALIDRCKVVTQAEIIASSLLAEEILNKKITLVSPDAGAEKKTQKVAQKLSKNENAVRVLYASKVRDTLTGHILSTQIHGELHGDDFIMLDDICDGGRTFIQLAKSLKDAGAKNIYLYVTHGIFSKGLSVFRENVKHIYCCHTFLAEEKRDKDFLTVFGVAK